MKDNMSPAKTGSRFFDKFVILICDEMGSFKIWISPETADISVLN